MSTKKYESPVVEFISFQAEDIMTTSGGNGIELPDDIWDL